MQQHNCEESHHTCFLDLSFSSTLLSSKIADIPEKLKYETILAPLFEYCFGTSDQDKVWKHATEEYTRYYNGECFAESDDSPLSLFKLQIDWIRDETFLFSKIFNLVGTKMKIIASKFGLWNNKRFILNPCHAMNNFFFPSEEFTNDRETMMELMKESGYNLKYASDELKNDKEIVKQAVKRNGNALGLASETLKDDKEVVLIALESMQTAYNSASVRLKNDRDVVFKAVSLGLHISQVSQKFNNDRELLLMSSNMDGYSTLKFSCIELRNDKEIVKQAVQQEPNAFEYASAELKSDREFVKEIVRTYGDALRCAAKEFLEDIEIVELALKSSPDAYHYISNRLNNDIEFISNLIGKRGFEYLPKEFSHDREIVLNSIKINETNFKRATESNREFILQAVKNNGKTLAFVNEPFKSDREIIMEAITQNGYAFMHIPDQYFNDEEIIIKAAQTATKHLYITKVFDKVSDSLKKNDRDLIMKCAGFFFQYLPRKDQLDRETVMEAVKTNPNDVLTYAYPLVVNDRVLAMRIVKLDGLLLGELPFKYRNDREIVSIAIQQNKKAFKFASNQLQTDLQILKLT